MNTKTWIEQGNKLCKSFQFNSFTEAFAFMAKVALIAERMGHHPSWTNEYDRVDIRLCTHDAGDVVTEKDHLLAEEIDHALATSTT